MSEALQERNKLPLRQVTSVKDLLVNENAQKNLAAVAAKHMNAERMMRVVANAIRTTPKLQQCEPISFLGALMQCAALGLEPNTILGHAYMIPFDKTLDRGKPNERKITEVQLVIGYEGLIDLARRSGHITSISTNIHYADDELWEYEEGTDAKLRHRPGAQAGQKLHAYAIAKFRDGGHAYVVLPWAHVMRIRDASQGYQTAKKYGKLAETPWVKHEDEMAKKTAIRALAKYLPLSVEFINAMSVDERAADYRGFAIDPTAGIAQPEGDDFIEGEAQPEAAGLVEQQSAGPDLNAELQRTERRQEPVQRDEPRPQQQVQQRAAAPAQERDPEPRQDQADTGPADMGPTDAPDPTLDSAYRQFMADVGQVGVSGAADLWADDLPALARRKPEVHAAIMAVIDASAHGDAGPAAPVDLLDSPFARTFLQDVADMGLEETKRFHAKQLDEMQASDPATYVALIARANEIENGGV